MKREGALTMKGGPVTLLGADPAVGDDAPDFRVVDGGFGEVTLSGLKGKVVLISAVPSLDTPVCSIQTQRFNKELAGLPDNVQVLTVSMDLPFAQARFCEAEGVDKVLTVSDHVWREFGENYGLLIEGMGLLTRAVWVVDAAGKIVYKQVVPEIVDEPDYDAALSAARSAAGA
jgi:thioredoxin-dependent peroxiredoxin